MKYKRNCQQSCPAYKKLETDNFHYNATLKLIRAKIKINSFTANSTVELINGVLRDE